MIPIILTLAGATIALTLFIKWWQVTQPERTRRKIVKRIKQLRKFADQSKKRAS